MKKRLEILLGLIFIAHLILGQDNKNKSQSPVAFNSSKKAKEIGAFMTALYERGQFTGSILVAERGQIIYKGAFGLANREQSQPFTLSTSEYIGSISKPFTALGIMILKERGSLTYDTPVRQIFSELPPCMQPVTIRHLLHHTSGLALFDDYPDMTEKDVFDILTKQETLRFTPGEKFEYCNAGYSLLGMVIEKISGKTLNDFLKDNIFQTLDMNNTSVNRITARNKVRAVGYNIYGDLNNYDTFMGGNASIISTVEDLFKWDQALYNPKFIKKETLEESFRESSITLTDPVYGNKSYGFGWWIAEHDGHKNVFHDGAFGGYRAYMERFLDERNTIIHLSNLRHNLFIEIREAIVNILEGKPYEFPKIPVSAWLYNKIEEGTIDSAIVAYHSLKNSIEGRDYNFTESELNSLGYYLLRTKRIQDAINIFLLNTKEYPESANTHDSLGEAYMADGKKELAISSYRRSLELNPDNYNATEMIKKLQN